MDDPRKQQVMKPPRPLVGSLQKLPTYPWMFSWPMNAHDRIVLTNREYYRGFPCPPSENTSYPYKRHWQFRDHLSDDRAPPAALDLRGGPADIQNVTRYSPYLTPYPETFLGRENTRCYVGIERRNRGTQTFAKRTGESAYYYISHKELEAESSSTYKLHGSASSHRAAYYHYHQKQ